MQKKQDPPTVQEHSPGVDGQKHKDGSVGNAVRQIRRLLLEGRFKPGQRLTLSQLSNEIGLSVMPIREALRKLEGEGLVSFHANRGAVVRSVDRRFLEDLYEVRAALEEVAVRRAIGNMTFAKAERLQQLCNDFDRAIETDNRPEIIAATRAVHMAIFQIAGNEHAERRFAQDWEIVQTLRLRVGYHSERLPAIGKELRALVDAIGQTDEKAAISIMRLHNLAGLEDLLVGLE